jgi:hypothetical protein
MGILIIIPAMAFIPACPSHWAGAAAGVDGTADMAASMGAEADFTAAGIISAVAS